jgi:hypothetical protein
MTKREIFFKDKIDKHKLFLDAEPSLDDLKKEMKRCRGKKPYEIGTAFMWKQRTKLLYDVYQLLKPVNKKEMDGHFESECFRITPLLPPVPEEHENDDEGDGGQTIHGMR